MGRTTRTALVTAVASACLAAGPASAATAEQVVVGEHLRLVSVTSPAMSSLAPGEQATWDVGVSVTTSGEATVDVTLQVLEATADTFEVSVARCDQRWTAEGCGAGEALLVEGAVTTGERTSLGATGSDRDPWYRVTVTMVQAGDLARADLQLVADGVGEKLVAAPGPGTPSAPGPLPETGLRVLGQVALAVAAVGTGLVLAAAGRSCSSRRAHPVGRPT